MDNQKIGAYLQILRKKQGLTQAELATICSVSHQAVSKWEKGESLPDIEILQKLSIFYKVSINEILNGEKESKNIKGQLFNNTIVKMVITALGFIIFFLPFIEFETYEFGYIVLSGYKLIFNGTEGLPIITTMVQFLIFLSQIVYSIFILFKVKNPNKNYITINLYLIVLLLVTFLINIFSGFYPMPQLFILGLAVGYFIINSSDRAIILTDEELSPSFNFGILGINKNYIFYYLFSIIPVALAIAGIEEMTKNYYVSDVFAIIVTIICAIYILLVVIGIILTVVKIVTQYTNKNFNNKIFKWVIPVTNVFLVISNFLAFAYIDSELMGYIIIAICAVGIFINTYIIRNENKKQIEA